MIEVGAGQAEQKISDVIARTGHGAAVHNLSVLTPVKLKVPRALLAVREFVSRFDPVMPMARLCFPLVLAIASVRVKVVEWLVDGVLSLRPEVCEPPEKLSVGGP